MSATTPLLEVSNLNSHYPVTAGLMNREIGRVRAVDGINFTLDRGETFGLVGESGCGKSTVARTIVNLQSPTDGSIRFDGVDITEMDASERRSFRRRVQIMFQNPGSSFDPRMTVGESVAEPLRVNGMRDADRRAAIVSNLLERVGLAAMDADRYPHQLSGGETQRAALARALVVNPDLLVADEPVSALDVSVQADILSLLRDLRLEFGMALLIISHDMNVVRQVSGRVAVMYLGQFVERGPTADVFAEPKHPYTRALLSAIPRPDPKRRRHTIPLRGDVPHPAQPPAGCRFHTRCPSIIQPAGVDLEQSTWRRIMDVVQRVETGALDDTGIREAVVAGDATVEHADAVGVDAFDSRLRLEFELPSPIADARVESAISRAARALHAGDEDAAANHLRAICATPCREHEPTLRAVGDEHLAACHLLEDTASLNADTDL